MTLLPSEELIKHLRHPLEDRLGVINIQSPFRFTTFHFWSYWNLDVNIDARTSFRIGEGYEK